MGICASGSSLVLVVRDLCESVAIEHEQLASAHALDKAFADKLRHVARDSLGAQAYGVGNIFEAHVDFGAYAAVVAQQQVLGKTATRVADTQHHGLFFRAIELGAYHADQAKCHAGMIGEHSFEVGAMNAAHA